MALPHIGKQLRVGVLGAGPAGLVLSGILARSRAVGGARNFDITVFERDERSRDQGAGWDINVDAKKAFERAGADWKQIVRQGSDTWRIFRVGVDTDTPVAVTTMPEIVKRFTGAGQPESNRQAMRESLLESIGDGATLRFSTKVSALELEANSTAALLGADGEKLGEFDLVVDASGVSSPLRKLRMDEEGSTEQWYNGLTMINGIVDDPESQLDPLLVRALGEGTVEWVGDGRDGQGGFIVILQRYGNKPDDKRAKMQTFFMRQRRGQLGEELALGDIPYSHISKRDHPEAFRRVIKLLKEQTSTWPSMFSTLIDSLEPVQVWDLHQFPFDARVRNDRTMPLVSIGDALHAMSPTSGSGGNLAVKDADDLATYILERRDKNCGELEDGLVPLMETLLARMESNQKKGEWNAKRFKRVLQTKEPVADYYNSKTFLEGAEEQFGALAKPFMSLMHIIHRLEGFGMGSPRK